jgi:hypothetical protein
MCIIIILQPRNIHTNYTWVGIIHIVRMNIRLSAERVLVDKLLIIDLEVCGLYKMVI